VRAPPPKPRRAVETVAPRPAAEGVLVIDEVDEDPAAILERMEGDLRK
jgi:hypothetical protein